VLKVTRATFAKTDEDGDLPADTAEPTAASANSTYLHTVSADKVGRTGSSHPPEFVDEDNPVVLLHYAYDPEVKYDPTFFADLEVSLVTPTATPTASTDGLNPFALYICVRYRRIYWRCAARPDGFWA